MSYNPGVPAINTRIDQTYNFLTTNFTVLNNEYGLDHYAFNDASTANQGHHKLVTLVQQSGDPTPSALGGIEYGIASPVWAPSTGAKRTEPYYAYDSTTSWTGTFAPMLPIKAFGVFDQNGYLIGSRYNILTVTKNSTNSFTVVLDNYLDGNSSQNAMDYVVLLSLKPSGNYPFGVNPAPSNLQYWYLNTYNNQFNIVWTMNTQHMDAISFAVLTA